MSAKNTPEYLIPRLRNKSGIRVIAMGDSISFGVGDHGGHEKAIGPGWAGRFAHDLSAARFVNVSRNGARVRDVLNHQLGVALISDFDLALICVGGNDVLRGDFNPHEIEQGLKFTVNKLHKKGIAVAIINLPHLARPIRIPKRIRRVFEARATILNQTIKVVCVDTGAKLVCLNEVAAINEKGFWHTDRMHPSSFGHQVISDRVRHALSLPRRSKKKLSQDNLNQSRQESLKWLICKGSIWLARRSVDLLPALFLLIMREMVIPTRHNQLESKELDFNNSTKKLFLIDFEENNVIHIMNFAYRAEVSSNRGSASRPLNDLINLPA